MSKLTNDLVAAHLKRTQRHKHVPTAMIPKIVPELPKEIDTEYICTHGGRFYCQFRVFKEWDAIVGSEYVELLHPGSFFDCKYLFWFGNLSRSIIFKLVVLF
jgi:hypothetical protein